MAFLGTVSSLSYKVCLRCLDSKLPVIHTAVLTALSACLNGTQESKFMPQKSQFNWESGRNLTLAQAASNNWGCIVHRNKVEKMYLRNITIESMAKGGVHNLVHLVNVETLSIAEGGVYSSVHLFNLVCYLRHHHLYVLFKKKLI